ncbi:MAG TPA: hypothetical protein VFV50_06225 [Bdellovibrionales bacterium]|nr:hypothetical protein [Bdellovibrionales bacterium]
MYKSILAIFTLSLAASIALADGSIKRIQCEGPITEAVTASNLGKKMMVTVHLNLNDVQPAPSTIYVQTGDQEIAREIKAIVGTRTAQSELGAVYHYNARLGGSPDRNGRVPYFAAQTRNFVKGVGAIMLDGNRAGLMGCQFYER